ncbi:MAG: AAA family ATPase [Bryobacteraceae bacterium]
MTSPAVSSRFKTDMLIRRIEVENFKVFASQSFDLHPHFNLLVGENGSGKTSVLDALAVAAGIWLVEPPDSTLASSRREIQPQEIRLLPELRGDRIQFTECKPTKVHAEGRIGDVENVSWTRQIRQNGARTTNAGAKQALAAIKDIYENDRAGKHVLCPIFGYYGAGRAWLPSNERVKAKMNGPARRWGAFYDCFEERIRFGDLRNWFLRETTERGNRGGEWRPGFTEVKSAILRCVPDADDLWFDTDRSEIVLSIHSNAQPFTNLSAGQRMMLALVADLAIKAVTQNAYMLPDVLAKTPGLILIDELDVHLHPKWQRRVASDLKRTFPSIQFVCTSHSPQVIGELSPEEIIILENGQPLRPPHSFGLDSNRILAELMDAPQRNPDVALSIQKLFELIDQERFPEANHAIQSIGAKIGADEPELIRARSLIQFLGSGE